MYDSQIGKQETASFFIGMVGKPGNKESLDSF